MLESQRECPGTVATARGRPTYKEVDVPKTIVAIVIWLAVIAFATWGILVLVRRRRAWNALSPEEQEHRRAVREADKGIKHAIRDYNKAVGNTRKELERAKTPQKLARFKTDYVGRWQDIFKSSVIGGVLGAREFILHDAHIKTPSGLHPLTPNVTASVDTAGNLINKSRSTLTRMGAGTVIAGPLGLLAGAVAKKNTTVDSRDVFLMVQGEDWADTTNCDPAKEAEKVRKFAQAVNVAAHNVERITAERERRVSELTKRLTADEADRSDIESAEQVRASLGDHPHVADGGRLNVASGPGRTS